MSTPAELRRQKILAKGEARLAKISGAAAAEGRVIGDSSVGIKKSVAPTISSYDDDPAEIDLSTISTQRPIPSASTTAPMDPFAAMMASMNGSTGGEGGFPGMGGAPGGDFLSQMMSSMATGSMPPTANGLSGTFPPTAPISPFINQKKTFIDRIFPFLHFLSMFSLACYAVFFAEPSYKVESLGLGEKVVDWSSWANLKYAAPVEFGTGMIGKLLYSGKGQLAAVPIFYLFITVQLILQTTRALLLKNREPTPSIISSVLPILSQFSPALGLLLRTSIHYISLLSICLNDLAVLVFLVGFFIILGDKISGPTLKAGIVEVISDTVEAGWNSARAEL